MDIIFAGDFCPQNNVSKIIENNQEVTSIFSPSIIDTINKADYSFVNLEAPIVEDDLNKISKSGPCLRAPLNTGSFIKKLGFKAVTLANNHLRDYNDKGVVSTISELNRCEIDHVGGGDNISSASQILYKQINNTSFAFINACEKEYSIAGLSKAGANPFNLVDLYYQIQDAKKKAKFIVLIYHGGIETFNLPTVDMVNNFHFLIDIGVDAIITHHQHCYSGYEVYKDKPIFYGIGNFCFENEAVFGEAWYYGFLVKLHFENIISFDIVPYVQCKGCHEVRLLNNLEQNVFRKDLDQINSIIKSTELLDSMITEFMKSSSSFYFPAVSPFRGRKFRLLKKLGLFSLFFSKKQCLYLFDVVNCDSHRNRFLNFLLTYINE